MRREVWIREFVTPEADAVLDIWAFGGQGIQDLLVDVTICHPMAAKYQPHASNEPGAAATKAAGKKYQRYPAAGGREITPFAVETWGRMDAAAEHLLVDLAAITSRRAMMRGQAVTASACLKKWRATLDATLQRGVAKSLVASFYGLPGRFHHRRWT